MAVLTNLQATEMVDGYRGNPTNDHGKLRYQFFTSPALVAQADVGSTVDLCILPSGRVRILPHLCRITNTAAGAGATLDIGNIAYNKTNADQEDADDNALTPDPLSVSEAADSTAFSQVMKFDVYSQKGVLLQAKAGGANWPVGFAFSGVIAYLYD